MNFNEFKSLIAAACADAGITDYELYYESGENTGVGVFQHEIADFSSSHNGGVCFRCIVDGKMGYASTEALSPEQARAVVSKAVDNAKALETEEQEFLSEGGQVYEPLAVAEYPLPSTEELIQTALSTQEKLYAADPMAVDGCQTHCQCMSAEIAIFNSKGLDLHHKCQTAAVVAVGVASNGEEMANDYQIKVGKLSDIDTDALAKKAVQEAKIKLGGDVAPTGQYPVVFDPQSMCNLLSTFRSIFSSEVAQKGLSKLADQEGQIIASPVVTLVDDPFHPENPMSINFDAEGSPAYRKCVIQKGVLNTLLYNLKTAAVAGKKTTGNASKAGYDAPIGISPFTMYLESGELTEEELLAKAGEGVYITSLGGLHAGANAISGDFSLQSSGFMIRDGKKAEYVKSFTVAGNFYDLLKNITAVANNWELPSPTGITEFGSPSVLVTGLSIAGK